MNARIPSIRTLGKLVVDAFNDWQKNNALRLSAALAYYSIFSIAPLLVLAVGLAGLFFGADAVSGHLYGQLKQFAGPSTALAIQGLVETTSKPSESLTATLVGFVVLFFGASGVFGQLKDALNTIWEVKARPGLGWRLLLRERLLSFGMVLVVGFLLLVSFVLTALISAFNKFLEAYLAVPGAVWALGLLISLAVVTSLFALIFKMLPDVNNQWRHVWVGAGATALLFEIGKFGLAYYLGREGTASGFGAAGSVVLLLLWVYYASCILLFGAEFTKVYAMASGDALRPSRIAVPLAGSLTYTPVPVPVGPVRESLPLIFAEVDEEPLPPAMPPGHGAPILAYAREHMTVGILGALGCGLAVGLASRAFPQTQPVSSDPGKQMKLGLRMLGAASLLLLTRTGRDVAGKIRKAVEQLPSKLPVSRA